MGITHAFCFAFIKYQTSRILPAAILNCNKYDNLNFESMSVYVAKLLRYPPHTPKYDMIKLLGYETVKTMQKYNDNRAISFVLQSNQIMYK